MRISSDLRRLLHRQRGLASRRQLLSSGVTSDAMAWGVRHHWRILLPGVYLLEGGVADEHQRLIAAQLLAGPRAALAGLTAARWHHLRAAGESGRVHLSVLAPQRSRSVAWVRIRRTTVDDPWLLTDGTLRVTSVARSVLDAATETGHPDQAAALAIEAVQRRLVSLDELIHVLGRLGQVNTHLARHAVAAAGTGAWSRPEAELLQILGRSRVLPEVWPNPHLVTASGRVLISPDAWVDDVAMAVMVHSRQFHAGHLDWETTVERDGELTAAGVVVVGVTPSRISRDPRAVLERVERTYLMARQRQRPAVTARRRRAA